MITDLHFPTVDHVPIVVIRSQGSDLSQISDLRHKFKYGRRTFKFVFIIIMPTPQSKVSKPSTASLENRGPFSPASDIDVQSTDALPAKSAHVQDHFSQAISGVRNVGCQGLISPAPVESVDIQGPFSQGSIGASENESSPSSFATSPRPSPTPAGSVDFTETSSTASTGVEESSLSSPVLQVFPDSFTVAPEDIRVKMDSIFEGFCKSGGIAWKTGRLLEL